MSFPQRILDKKHWSSKHGPKVAKRATIIGRKLIKIIPLSITNQFCSVDSISIIGPHLCNNPSLITNIFHWIYILFP